MKAFREIIRLTGKYPVLRGMLAYGMLWPCGSLIQQTIEGKRYDNYDWKKCIRYSFYGSFVLAPSIFYWIRFLNIMWPRTNLRSALAKAVTEQFSYDPALIAIFLYTMTLMEGKTTKEAKIEVTEKFVETYQVGMIYWPIVQTINFSCIPPRNQVVFMSVFSMIWSSFLCYIKHLEIERLRLIKAEKKRKSLVKRQAINKKIY